MIWQLGSSQTFIAGSIHALQENRNSHQRIINEIYKNAKHLVFETDLDSKPDSIIYYKNSNLSQEVSKTLFKDVKREWHKNELPPKELEKSKIWWAALKLNTANGAKKGIIPTYGVDRIIWDQAQKDNKTVAWLETTEAGLGCFNSSPIDEQIKLLSKATRNRKDEMKQLISILESWNSSDIQSLASIVEKDLAAYPKTFHCLLAERNNLWIEEIIEAVTTNSATLFVLGVFHCLGKYSLLELLNENGITAELING